MKMRNAGDALRQRGRRWLNDSGAAAVEFALVLPVILLILFGTIEFGRAWNVRQTLTDAAREGARVAAVNNGLVTPAATLADSVKKVVTGSAQRAGLDLLQLTIDPVGVGQAAGTPVRINVAYGYKPLFGSWVLTDEMLTIRTYSVMRNE
jgi:Flp pilus assembly protein TadG